MGIYALVAEEAQGDGLIDPFRFGPMHRLEVEVPGGDDFLGGGSALRGGDFVG